MELPFNEDQCSYFVAEKIGGRARLGDGDFTGDLSDLPWHRVSPGWTLDAKEQQS